MKYIVKIKEYQNYEQKNRTIKLQDYLIVKEDTLPSSKKHLENNIFTLKSIEIFDFRTKMAEICYFDEENIQRCIYTNIKNVDFYSPNKKEVETRLQSRKYNL